MLVLKRRVDQSLVVTIQGHSMRIKVINISGHYVTLGFEADTKVKILREELVGVGP